MSEHRSRGYRQPFYKRRPLCFECSRCGACCAGGDDYHVFLSRDEAEKICHYLGLSWPWFRRRYLLSQHEEGLVLQSQPDGNCIFLDAGGQCRVYDVRPRQCATYPFWPELVMSSKAWRREARRCEGIGKGAMVPVQLIEAAFD